MTPIVIPGGEVRPWLRPHTRSERLIAGGRVVLAAVALLAVWVDPAQPARHAAVTYGALAGYLGYALVAAALVARPPVAPPWLSFATQVVDVAASPVLMYLTEGPASPFFVYILFPLLSATLRWHWRGTVWTGVVSPAIFLGWGVGGGRTLPAALLSPDRFLIRAAFLGVMVVLLGALDAHEQALRAQLVRLARGPRSVSLRERVTLLGGDLLVDSSEDGARLEMRVPLDPWLP